MLGWFDTKELDGFADTLVADLLERVPPSGGGLSGAKGLDRVRRTFGAAFERIDAFARTHKLNVYKKAHFANRIRWALKEAGYPDDFCATMTQELLMHLAPPPRREKGK